MVDLKTKHLGEQYIAKMANRFEYLAHEIKILNKMSKKAQTSREFLKRENQHVPRVMDFGMLTFENLKSDVPQTKKQRTAASLYGYYIMP